LALQLGTVGADIFVNLGTVALVEVEHAADKLLRERRQLCADLFRRPPLLVQADHRVEPDPVARQADLAVGVAGQKSRQVHHPFPPRTYPWIVTDARQVRRVGKAENAEPHLSGHLVDAASCGGLQSYFYHSVPGLASQASSAANR